jgi:predicted amino acid racemase
MAKININLTKIAQNFQVVNQICQNNHLELVVVTKSCCGDKRIIQCLIDAGAKIIAEFQPQNFTGITREVEKIVLYSSLSLLEQDFSCDFIYITDLKILDKYSQLPLSKQSQVIIPIELGDMREGILPEDLIPFLKQAIAKKNVRIAGLSANFGCVEVVKPKIDYFNAFIDCIKEVEYQMGFEFAQVLIGGTSSWNLLCDRILPKKINRLRIGEGILLGYSSALQIEIPDLAQDTFILEGEILEISTKKKPSQRRAIIDFGYTSTLAVGLRSKLPGIEMIASNQDITVIDITHANVPLATGDSIEFLLTYESLLRAMISPYIEKVYVYNTSDSC